MKKTAFLFLMLLYLVSCGTSKAHIGHWSGTVLMVNANYQFFTDGTFTAETYSSNNIMIGGGSGTYLLEGDTLRLNYEKKYVYDSQNDSGEWVEDDKNLIFLMEISGNQMSLTRHGSTLKMVLQKQ